LPHGIIPRHRAPIGLLTNIPDAEKLLGNRCGGGTCTHAPDWPGEIPRAISLPSSPGREVPTCLHREDCGCPGRSSYEFAPGPTFPPCCLGIWEPEEEEARRSGSSFEKETGGGGEGWEESRRFPRRQLR
jgi:hypothetical protein